jgi:hypothetical protein
LAISKWLKKRWRRGAKWLLVAVAGSTVAFLVSHFGEELLAKEDDRDPGLRIVAESSMVNPAREDSAQAEYICLVNEGDEAVSLTAWKLYDSASRVNEFSQFSLDSGESVRVHPGGRPRPNSLFDVYGTAPRPRWINSGDTIVLRDSEDEKVEEQSYPARGDGDVSENCGPAAKRSDWDCPVFSTHAQAQAFFLAQGGPKRDPYDLDADGDGLACE